MNPMSISYSIVLDEERRTFRLLLRLPAEPLWRSLRKHFGEGGTPGSEEVLTLFPDPRMIREIFEGLVEAEGRGFRSAS